MTINGSTFNQLTVFSAIAEQKSISGAARKLTMSSPSVSHALKLLESQVGQSLFRRTTRRIELTDAGRRLLSQISDPMNVLADTMEEIKSDSMQPQGPIRITMPRFAFHWLIAPIYANFCAEYPLITLEISLSDGLVDIVKDEYDMGIRFGDKVSLGMVAKQLTNQLTEALVATPDYLQKHGRPTTVESLQHHKFIQYRFIASNQIAPLILVQSKQEITVPTNPAIVVNDTDLALSATLEGLGIGRIAESNARACIDRGKLVPILENFWKRYPPLYLYFQQRSQKTRRNRLLIDYILSMCDVYRSKEQSEK